MIDQQGPVRVIMNDNPGNAPGDFAAVRIEVGLVQGYVGAHVDEGWRLVGFGYVARIPNSKDYVDLVYRFEVTS
jgi:hypothetical protein